MNLFRVKGRSQINVKKLIFDQNLTNLIFTDGNKCITHKYKKQLIILFLISELVAIEEDSKLKDVLLK